MKASSYSIDIRSFSKINFSIDWVNSWDRVDRGFCCVWYINTFINFVGAPRKNRGICFDRIFSKEYIRLNALSLVSFKIVLILEVVGKILNLAWVYNRIDKVKIHCNETRIFREVILYLLFTCTFLYTSWILLTFWNRYSGVLKIQRCVFTL